MKSARLRKMREKMSERGLSVFSPWNLLVLLTAALTASRVVRGKGRLMKKFLPILCLFVLWSPGAARAQLAPPNKLGVAMGQLHYVVPRRSG